MFRRSLGFVPLIWQCAFCNTQNPGPIKSCTSCGAPQPADVAFLQVDEEKFNFIKDEALIRMAKAGPDIHCPFCGTRNRATEDLCKQCGGDLSWDGKQRETGSRVRTVSEAEAPQPPPSQSTTEKKKRKTPLIAILVGLAVVVGCIVMLVMFLSTDDVTAAVSEVQWERSIAIEAYTTVTDSAWWDEVPEGGEVTTCSMVFRYNSEEPQPNATEVCSEPYVEDTGTGIGEVVQDCTFEVYDDYCDYTTMAWVAVDAITETGQDLSPMWPTLVLEPDQREGTRTETYIITFRDGNDSYRFNTSNAQLFTQAEIGSRWTLQINQFGGVQSIEPAN